jgi:superoxide oxidase
VNIATRTPRYSLASLSLHWVMLILIATAYLLILLREYYPKGSDFREGLKMWHFMVGLSVLLLVIIRIVARLSSRVGPITPAPPAWQVVFAKTIHGTLYAFMIAMPILGWLILSASGKTIPFFGLELPALVAPDKAFAGDVQEMHELIGTIAYYVIGLHAVAALFHHYYIKDNTLRRMMPGPN